MKHEFVPYEQALALKELGFDEPCFGYYFTLNGKDWEFAEKSEYYRLDDEINIGGKFSLLAPTFSQAFRWFREEHDLDNAVLKDRYVIETQEDLPVWYYGFKTHEEAELDCLIKLIEIVKEKK